MTARSVRILIVVGLLAACQSKPGPSPTIVATTTATSTTTSSTSTTSTIAETTSVADLADYTPPPGALNPAVTQDTIGTTICVTGWTATIRPPVSYTTPLKLAQMAARHLPGTAAGYEEDHMVPLELGGAPRDPANLWPEPRTGPHASADAKDHTESALRAKVCAGTMTLAAARYEIDDPSVWGKL